MTPSPCQCSARAAQNIWEHHRPAVGSSMRALGAGAAPQRSDECWKGLSGAPRATTVIGAVGVGRTPHAAPRPSGGAEKALRPREGLCEPPAYWEAEISPVIGINQTNHSTDQERPCTTVHRIKKELSICPSRLCPDLVTFPVLSQIKPHTPRLVVPFRQFL